MEAEAKAEAARSWEPAEETLEQLRGSSRAAPGRVEGRGPCLRAQGGRLLFLQSGWGTGCTRVSQNSPELPEPAEMGGEVCVPGPLRPGPGRVAWCWSIIPAPKGCGSDSQSGHILRLWVRSLVKVTNQCWVFSSLSLSLAPFLGLNITSLGED